MNNLLIVQHNILNWNTNKDSVTYNFLQVNPDVILINSHGLKSNQTLNIPGYKIHKINSSETTYDGSAIAIKINTSHEIYDDFLTDVLAMQIETSLDPIIIATTYLPSRRPYLPYPDIHRFINNTIPTYIIGDLNANHRMFGNHCNNTVGKKSGKTNR